MKTCFILIISLFAQATLANTSQKLGDIGRYLLPASAVAITVSKEDATGLKQFGLGFATSLAITQLLKQTINERRPNGESTNSFPSGHTAWAFSAATYLAKRYGRNYGIPAYLGASLVGISRIHNKRHYVHDVIAGAAIATTITYLFTSNYHNDNLVVGFSVKNVHNSLNASIRIGVTV